jgi:glycosyltransferase involved in cell wall biosynthesis
MNNIELEQLKRDIIDFYGDAQMADNINKLSNVDLARIKLVISKLKKQKQLEHRISKNKKDNAYNKLKSIPPPTPNPNQPTQPKFISIPHGVKPKIVLISDVKGWAWWIKSEYIKKYLSDEFDIDIKCIFGNRDRYNDTKKYDLYFTFGYSYIKNIDNAPKYKRASGITAHRHRETIRSNMNKVNIIHANSMLLKNELHDMGFKKVYYVPNGVDEELFRPVTPIPLIRDNINVGHVGKESPLKGQQEFIYPAVKKAGANFISNVKNWSEKKPYKDMWEIYQNMDCFIVASIEDGTPNPALEAAACGRPIISNRIGNMPEFIRDGYNGFLVDKNINAYVEKINYLKNNRDKLIEMGNNARKTVEGGWTWKIQAENYRKMFKEIFTYEGA